MPNVYENGFPVIVPRNWMKFGLKVDEVQVKIHQIWVSVHAEDDGKRDDDRSSRNGRSPIMEHYLLLHSRWSNIVKSVYLAMSLPMEVDCRFAPVTFPGRTF